MENIDKAESNIINDDLITNTGDSFRDKVGILDKKGKRIWLHPKKPKGKFHRARVIVSIFLIAFLFITPFIKINDEPLLLFDIFNRKFIIFGLIFWPQDLFIFALGFLAFVVFVVLFTAIYGRIFCGWICPQTIFLEMVFRKIEYWIEGDSHQQIKLKKAPWTTEKILKKTFKQSIFLFISFLIGNVLLSYIVGIDKLYQLIADTPAAHPGEFTAILGFTGLFYFIFAWFREQACTFVCPYARLQSVLLDNNTIVVAYDFKRGEERKPLKQRDDNKNYGDCIDCKNCVRVCPTGIDIRNGTQLECVNCTACIDACDEVMVKINKPKKLIKYASFNQINNNQKFKLTPRIILYSVLLLILISVVGALIASRSNIDTNILRAQGALPQQLPDGNIVNLYTMKVLNKTHQTIPIELKLENLSGNLEIIGTEKLIVNPGKLTETSLLLKIPKQQLKPYSNKIKIGVYSNGKYINSVETTFLNPIN